MSSGTIPASVQIVPVTAQDVRRDQSGNLPEAWSRLTRDEFAKAPWDENYDVTRLSAGLGIDLSRLNAVAFAAQTKEGGFHMGHVLGYELYKYSDPPRIASLQDISGTAELDEEFDKGRLFYIDSIVVREVSQGARIGRELLQTLIRKVQLCYGITRFILRTHVEAYPARKLFSRVGFQETDVHDKEDANRTYWILDLNQQR